MKVIVKKEFDGRFYIASCENVPGCYVQSNEKETLNAKLQNALSLYKRNCDDRHQPLPEEEDRPVLDMRIRFSQISTSQLVRIFVNHNYHVEYVDEHSVLLLNSEFPFNRIHLPQSKSLSPLILQKIFGKENIAYVRRNNLKINTSAS